MGQLFSVSLAWDWCLADALPEQRQHFGIIGDGNGAHWPDVDENIRGGSRPADLHNYIHNKGVGMLRKIRRFVRRAVDYFTLNRSEWRHRLVGPPNLWKMKRDFQIAFLRDHGLRPDHYLLDIGCGTLRGGIPLIKYLKEGHYFGVESRKRVMEQGILELQESGLAWKKPILSAAEKISQHDLHRTFDYIWAFSVLIHMSDDILGETFGFVRDHLADDGYFYANVNIGDQSDDSWQGFPHVWRSVSFYEAECAKCGLSMEDIGLLGKLGHVAGIEKMDNQHMLKIWKTKPISVR